MTYGEPMKTLEIKGAATTGKGIFPLQVVTAGSGRTFAIAFDEEDARRVIRLAAVFARTNLYSPMNLKVKHKPEPGDKDTRTLRFVISSEP